MSRVRRAAMVWLPVSSAAVVVAVLLSAFSGQYGYHRDELYFRMLPFSWGYVDQPPLTPILAHLSTAVFGDTVWAMRIPATLCMVTFVVLGGLVARDLGGGRLAQGLAAWGLAFSAVPLSFGHLLLTATVDLPVWLGVVLFTIRALRRDPRWWLAAGACAGVGMYNKFLIVLLLIGLAIGLLCNGSHPQQGRRVLLSGWLWGGVAVALLVAAPNLIYQATHGWPQFTMAAGIDERGGAASRVQLIPHQFLLLGPLLAPIWIAGLVGIFRAPQWQPLRSLAWAYLAVLVIVLGTGGQMYYSLGLVAFAYVAGCVRAEQWTADRVAYRGLVVGAVAFNCLGAIVIGLPIVPVAALGSTPIPAINQAARDQVGWPTYVGQVAEVYRRLPATDADRTVIVTGNYGEAGALNRFGGTYGLPPVYSGHNELYFRGSPAPTTEVVVLVGISPSTAQDHFTSCERAGTLDNGVDIDNEEQGRPIFVCRSPRLAWTELWPTFQHYN
ncbi:glycosyltransferase family 39 protein [Nocardia sp. NPDC051570]|uniref:glycosyltransferase family 39 protein n=1 Tax=Nocardia sp. NPDC051570 TaxID=3364324 RepID=UPI0037A93A3F